MGNSGSRFYFFIMVLAVVFGMINLITGIIRQSWADIETTAVYFLVFALALDLCFRSNGDEI